MNDVDYVESCGLEIEFLLMTPPPCGSWVAEQKSSRMWQHKVSASFVSLVVQKVACNKGPGYDMQPAVVVL